MLKSPSNTSGWGRLIILSWIVSQKRWFSDGSFGAYTFRIFSFSSRVFTRHLLKAIATPFAAGWAGSMLVMTCSVSVKVSLREAAWVASKWVSFVETTFHV